MEMWELSNSLVFSFVQISMGNYWTSDKKTVYITNLLQKCIVLPDSNELTLLLLNLPKTYVLIWGF